VDVGTVDNISWKNKNKSGHGSSKICDRSY